MFSGLKDYIHLIFGKIAKIILKMSILSNKMNKSGPPVDIKEVKQIMLQLTEEESKIFQEIFDSIRERSHLYIIDKAFKCLRIHFALYALKKAK